MKKFANLFVTVCFLLFLTAAMVITTTKEKEPRSFYENRNLAVMPVPTKETLISGQFGTDMEKYLADHVAGRRTLLSANTYINLHILHQPLVNQVVITDDYLLPELADWMEDTSHIDDDAAAITNNLTSVAEVTERCGGRYYYVAVPCQYVYHQDDYPWFMNNRSEYTQKSLEVLRTNLNQAGINFIDMGEVFNAQGWPDGLSSAVDNHFSIQGAYQTYRTIMERINQDTGLGLDLLEDGEYVIEELPNHYLGSRLRKLMDQWELEEKLGILTPLEPVPFTRTNYGGSPSPSIVYSLPDTPEDDVLYTMYMGGDIADTVIDTDRRELPSILIYGDSFTNAVECILFNSFDTMYSLDLRYYKDMSLGQFIETYRPDFVVCVRDYESLLDTNFNGSPAYPAS